MSVTPINNKRREALARQFDDMVADAATIAIVSVTNDGGVSFMLPDSTEHDIRMVSALEVAKLAVLDRLDDL
jgi:hypothetical protein